MSGGRFLVSLVEVNHSERILSCRALLKENVDFWLENLAPELNENEKMVKFSASIAENDSYLQEAELTTDGEEVATTVAGYIGKKLTERSKCPECKICIVSPKGSTFDNIYFNHLSRGGLTIPSPSLAEFAVNAFAILDAVEEKIGAFPQIPTLEAADFVLKKYCIPVRFTCPTHINWGLRFSTKSIINIFYNNKQKISQDAIRKDMISGFKKRQRDKSD